jgi:hypothetical protein
MHGSYCDETAQFAKITAMQSLNESLQLTPDTPRQKIIDDCKYPTRKMKRTENGIKT